MKLTPIQKEVLRDLRAGRKMTLRHYIGDSENATWDDIPWSPCRKNYAVVIRALRKKKLVDIVPDPKVFHAFSIALTEEGTKVEL